MKRIIICLCLILGLSAYTSGQLKIPVGSSSDINKFLNSTTYIVLENELLSDFNMAMRDAVEVFWDITPYEFIYASDFNRMRQDDNKSFLVVNQVYFEGDRSEALFDFLILTNGGNYRTVNDMPNLCAVPLAINGADATDYDYKLALIVKFVQKHVRTTKNNPRLTDENIADFYVEQAGSLESKKFYVLREELNPSINSRTSFADNYDYAFKFSSKAEIQELIESSDDNAIILHKIGPRRGQDFSRSVKIVLCTKKADIYYYSDHRVSSRNPNALLRRDLRSMSRQ